MFPIQPSAIFNELTNDTFRATRRGKQPSRLDIQRLKLEYDKMNDINFMIADQRALDRDNDLVRRQMLAKARGDRAPFGAKIRQSIGAALISIGERIRPELVQSEPTFNA